MIGLIELDKDKGSNEANAVPRSDIRPLGILFMLDGWLVGLGFMLLRTNSDQDCGGRRTGNEVESFGDEGVEEEAGRGEGLLLDMGVAGMTTEIGDVRAKLDGLFERGQGSDGKFATEVFDEDGGRAL
jgi:hypothetical protein